MLRSLAVIGICVNISLIEAALITIQNVSNPKQPIAPETSGKRVKRFSINKQTNDDDDDLMLRIDLKYSDFDLGSKWNSEGVRKRYDGKEKKSRTSEYNFDNILQSIYEVFGLDKRLKRNNVEVRKRNDRSEKKSVTGEFNFDVILRSIYEAFSLDKSKDKRRQKVSFRSGDANYYQIDSKDVVSAINKILSSRATDRIVNDLAETAAKVYRRFNDNQ